MFPETIFKYITEQENAFDTEEVQVGNNWRWNFKNHVQMIFHLKNGVFFQGENDWMRSFKNIMEPVLSLAYWTEDIEVKDVAFFIENIPGRVASFMIKKYHDEVYVREHDLDEMFDEITESDVDYGGVLVDTLKEKRPTVVPLPRIAFCDQTDVTGGPIGFKLFLAPSKLRAMEKSGWFKKENGATGSASELIALASDQKAPDGLLGQQKNTTTGKQTEVYIVSGDLPSHYLTDDGDTEKMVGQIQIVAFYTDKNKKKQYFTCYRKTQEESPFEFYSSQKITGRAIGRGWGERMLHPQIWTNFLEIHKTQMLQAAAKVPLYTDDETFTNRNIIQDMENLEVTTIKEGRRMFQVPTAATANIQLFKDGVNSWFEYAQYAGAAFDPLMGKESSSGTTFRGQNQVVQQGRGPHDRLRGKRAKFLELLYRKYIIPDIKKEITKGKKFLATLSGNELQWVREQLAENYASEQQIEDILNGAEPRDPEILKEEFRVMFQKKGSQHLLEIIKGEFEGIEMRIGINIASKQKDLAGLSDKVLSIFQFVMSNPANFQQGMQIPGMSDAMNSILEYSGVNQSEFMGFTQKLAEQQVQQAQAVQQPAQEAQMLPAQPQMV